MTKESKSDTGKLPAEQPKQRITLSEYVAQDPDFASILQQLAQEGYSLQKGYESFRMYDSHSSLLPSKTSAELELISRVVVCTVVLENGFGFMYTSIEDPNRGDKTAGTSSFMGPGAALELQALRDLGVATIALANIPSLKLEFKVNFDMFKDAAQLFFDPRFVYQIVVNSGNIAPFLSIISRFTGRKVDGVQTNSRKNNVGIPLATAKIILKLRDLEKASIKPKSPES